MGEDFGAAGVRFILGSGYCSQCRRTTSRLLAVPGHVRRSVGRVLLHVQNVVTDPRKPWVRVGSASRPSHDEGDGLVADRNPSYISIVRGHPVVRTAGGTLFCLAVAELGRMVRPGHGQLGRDRVLARGVLRRAGWADAAPCLRDGQLERQVPDVDALRALGSGLGGILVGGDLRGGAGGGAVVAELGLGSSAGVLGHDVVRPLARDGRDRRGLGDRGRPDRRLQGGGRARVAGEPRELIS